MGEDPTDEEDAREYKKDIIEKIQKKALDQLESYL
jgi:hypothetical protein